MQSFIIKLTIYIVIWPCRDPRTKKLIIVDLAGRRWRSWDPRNSSEYGSVDKKTCGMLLLMIPIMLRVGVIVDHFDKTDFDHK